MKSIRRKIGQVTMISFVTSLAVLVLLLCMTGVVSADTYVNGIISVDTTWDATGSPYIVDGDIWVYNTTSTPTLTIEPGVTVKFNQQKRMMIGYSNSAGRLIADGSAGDEIVFTGAAKTKGYWRNLYFWQTSGGSLLNNVTVEYGGSGSDGSIYLYNASVNITNSTIANSSNYGIYSTGSVSIEDNNFVGNGNYPLSLSASDVDCIRGNTFTSNTPNEIELRGGTVSTDSVMRNQGVPYRVSGGFGVSGISSTPPTLTIEPGITVKFDQDQGMYIGTDTSAGRLIADGSAGDEIVFTGASKTKGYWSKLYFYQNSDGSLLDNVKVEYGGSDGWGNIHIRHASVNITNSTISNSSNYGIYPFCSHLYQNSVNIRNNAILNNSGYGVYIYGGYASLSVEDNNFVGNGNYPLSLSASDVDCIRGNTFTSNTPNEIELRGGTVSTDSVMRNQGVPYRVSGGFGVSGISSTPPTLTIEPGITVKFDQDQGMYIGTDTSAGRLIADGSAGDEIVFTGASKTKGYWSKLYFYQNSDGSLLDNVKVEYGGSDGWGNIHIRHASVNITNSTISNSSNYGIYPFCSHLYQNSVNIRNNAILNNSGYGVYIYGGYASLSVEDNNFVGNGNYPLSLSASDVDCIRGNTFTSNTPNEIELRGGTVSTDSVMRNQGVPYRVSGGFGVSGISSTPPTLTIEPGITVKFDQDQGMYIGTDTSAGRLIADGSAGDEIVFTGASKTKGYWSKLYFYQNSDGSLLDNVKVEYGGSDGWGNIHIRHASVNITNSTISNSSNYGIYMQSGENCVINSNRIYNNTNYGIYVILSSSNCIYNNYFNNTNNAYDDRVNAWNITATAGTNIIGGPYLGGNYWSNYTGKDQDGDGLGDTLTPHNSSGGIQTGGDYLPLTLVGPDTTPPASITNLQNVTGQTWINWSWTNPPDADFNYTMVYLDGVLETNTSKPCYNATGLAPDTNYEIGTHTVDQVGNMNTTWVNQTTKTLPGQDTTPPVITNVTATNITMNSATISWDTDEPSDSLVKYGTESGNYVSTAYDAADVTTHHIALTGLSANTTYYYVVNSTDASGNSNESIEHNFSTLTPPTVIPANIVIKPETLNLNSTGVFTAFITLPEGYNIIDIDISTVICEGALAVKGMVADDNKYIAKFDREDLTDVEPGDAVTIAVMGTLYDKTPFAGNDTITVISEG